MHSMHCTVLPIILLDLEFVFILLSNLEDLSLCPKASGFVFRSVTNGVELVVGSPGQGLADAFYFFNYLQRSLNPSIVTRRITFDIFSCKCQTRGDCISIDYVINQQLMYTEASGSFMDLRRITWESCTTISVPHNFRGSQTTRLYAL